MLATDHDFAGAYKTTNARFSKGVRLMSELGLAEVSRKRVRELEVVRDFLQDWTTSTRRDVAAINKAMAEHDLEAETERARARPSTDRTAEAKRLRQVAAGWKDARDLLGTAIAYLEVNRSMAAVMRRLGAPAPTPRERKLVASVDRANAALRRALEQLVENVDEGVDSMLVMAARIDPENDAPAKSLDEIAAE